MTWAITEWGVVNIDNIVVGRVATEAEAVALAAKLNAEHPHVEYDTPRGRRITEMVNRRGGTFVVVTPEILTNWAMVEFSR